MKLTATKFFAAVTEPCFDWFSPLSALFSIIALMVLFLGLALACKTLVEPFAWRH